MHLSKMIIHIICMQFLIKQEGAWVGSRYNVRPISLLTDGYISSAFLCYL